MSVHITIPEEAQVRFPTNIFSATFGAITPGRYDFTQTAGNINQLVFNLNRASIYLLTAIDFSANTAEMNYQEAIDQNSLPQIRLRTSRTQQMVFISPIAMLNYWDDKELVLFIKTTQQDDRLEVSFEGLMSQSPGLIGQAVLETYLKLTIYEIQATQWIERFRAGKTDLGANLNMRGRC